MSRSNPTNNNPNPSTRWFEWHGSKGVVRYYDKEKKENVEVPLPFPFFVLDILSTVKGWHEASESGIFANEVRDTKQDVLNVRSFKGGELASGLYQDIRDRVGNLGGYFVSSIYIGYKNADGNLAIGNLNLNGAALGAWSNFRKDKAKGQMIFDKACKIVGYTDGQKGSVKFRVPKFELFDAQSQTSEQAVELDKELQEYLKGYMARPKVEAAQAAATKAEYAAVDAEFTPAPSTADDEAYRIAEQQSAKRATRPLAADDMGDELPDF